MKELLLIGLRWVGMINRILGKIALGERPKGKLR